MLRKKPLMYVMFLTVPYPKLSLLKKKSKSICLRTTFETCTTAVTEASSPADSFFF